jgi:hypothetical protein
MRAFVRLRDLLAGNRDLARKLAALEEWNPESPFSGVNPSQYSSGEQAAARIGAKMSLT